jgi:hypothetical protein
MWALSNWGGKEAQSSHSQSFFSLVEIKVSVPEKKNCIMNHSLHCWVMHPVACVLIKYFEDLRMQQILVYCVLPTPHVSAPIGGHLQVIHKYKNISWKSRHLPYT